ncbi:hypothetical protein LA080_015744 [Diaporthe eres]|nr:hypothetical protein LA080_015744 [Diaporthe eres]
MIDHPASAIHRRLHSQDGEPQQPYAAIAAPSGVNSYLSSGVTIKKKWPRNPRFGPVLVIPFSPSPDLHHHSLAFPTAPSTRPLNAGIPLSLLILHCPPVPRLYPQRIQGPFDAPTELTNTSPSARQARPNATERFAHQSLTISTGFEAPRTAERPSQRVTETLFATPLFSSSIGREKRVVCDEVPSQCAVGGDYVIPSNSAASRLDGRSKFKSLAAVSARSKAVRSLASQGVTRQLNV